MKKVVAVLLLAGLALWFLFRDDSRETPIVSPSEKPPGQEQGDVPSSLDQVRLIEQNPFIEDYGREGGSHLKDLESLRDVVNDCQLLFKDFDRYHLPGNPEITKFLQGGNPDKLAWIPPGHSAVNSEGELVDRSGVPVFFHRLSGMRFELRSSGEDGRLWTDDDVILR